jgi:SAM-dependent methyltransferase
MLEYLSMGRVLEQTRFAFVGKVGDSRKALVLGDGDGRFTAKLLEENRSVQVTAVDVSAEMLHLLRDRCSWALDRLVTVQSDALSFCRTDSERYDLVATHFFLDCLLQREVDELAALVGSRTEQGAVWVVSEFAIPHGPMRFPARVIVQGLYGAFRLMTGLRVSQLPDHISALAAAGFVRMESQSRLGGILCSERWMKRETDEKP